MTPHPTHAALRRGLEFFVIALVAAAIVIGPLLGFQQAACASNAAVYGGCHVEWGAALRGLAIAFLGGLGKALLQFLEILRDHMLATPPLRQEPMSQLQTVLKTVAAPVIAGAVEYVTANQPKIIAAAAGTETKAIDAIATVVVATLPKTGILAALRAPLTSGLKSYESQIIDALGGEEAALIAVALHQLETFGLTGLL